MGALFAAAGIAGFVVLLVSNTNPDLRIVLPGSHQLELEKEATRFSMNTEARSMGMYS